MLQVIPQVKQANFLNKEQVKFDNSLNISLDMETHDNRIKSVLQEFFPTAPINEKSVASGKGYVLRAYLDSYQIVENTDLTQIDNMKEGYYLRIENSSFYIYGTDVNGLFYGIQTLYQLTENYQELPSVEIFDWPDTELRCMNYDLRHTYPTFDNLVNYLKQFARFKANAVLIEYEDKLPFQEFAHLQHPNYTLTKEQLKQLQEIAKQYFIDIIPLQQTFGHLEYVLKHEQYKPLRELNDSIGELCPSNKQSLKLAKELIMEMIELHPATTYLHLGCDEVYSLCSCNTCKAINDGSREQTFITYVNELVDFVIENGKTPIIWHDMMVKCSEQDIQKLDKRVVVMIWIYDGKDVEPRVAKFTSLLRNNGIEVFGAPSVRCFDRLDDQNYPIVENRIQNVDQWATIADKLQLSGMVSTNWGTVFGMGVPYGIFETSWYLVGYSCDKWWNLDASSEMYLERFLRLFHGINLERLEDERKYDIEDYYDLISDIADTVPKNQDVARLIQVMKEYEVPAMYSRTIHKYIYRWMIGEQIEAEKISLSIKYNQTYQALQQVKPRMEQVLQRFLVQGMVDHYLHSRFYLFEYLDDNLYKKSGLLDK